jgi:hypothetical protein
MEPNDVVEWLGVSVLTALNVVMWGGVVHLAVMAYKGWLKGHW